MAVFGVVDKITGKLLKGGVGTKEKCDSIIESEKVKVILAENYELIKQVFNKYVDMPPEHYEIIALWIIGTYFHADFNSYPFLFFNAMRGSGKTRTVKLVTYLSKDGILMSSPTEAVLFRSHGTLGIDEFEGVANKDKSSIRELLNTAYKKGSKVMRMKKKKSITGEEQVVEEFEPYRPIVMANIYGMEEVLADRCISLVLEKSDDPYKTRLTEDFEHDNVVTKIKKNFEACRLCRDVSKKNIQKKWNDYLFDRYKNTLDTYNTTITLTTQMSHTHITMSQFFNKIHDSEIKGRDLELFFPLFIIGNDTPSCTLQNIIEIAKKLTSERTHEEEVESRDVMVIDFVANQEQQVDFQSMKYLTQKFSEFCDEQGEWLNSRWLGRAFKRLGLIIDKRRTHQGREIILNSIKAKKKIMMFRSEQKNAQL